jgi:hypothetical protein
MLRKLGIGALALVGGCLGLFAAAFAVAQTGPARDQISGYVADTLSNPQRQAEVEQLGGLLPFDIRLGRFALRDDKGVWLEVNDARVKLNPGALLKGQVHVEEAGARRVAVDHLPPSGPEPPPSDEPFRCPRRPSCPRRSPSPASTGCTSTGSRSAHPCWARRPCSAWRAAAARTRPGRPPTRPWRSVAPTRPPRRSTSPPSSTSPHAGSASA